MCSLCLASHIILLDVAETSKAKLQLISTVLLFPSSVSSSLLWYLQFCVFSTYFLFGLQNKQVWINWLVSKYDFCG